MDNSKYTISIKVKKLVAVLSILFSCMIYRLLQEENNDFYQSDTFIYCFYDKFLLEYIQEITVYLSQHLMIRDLLLTTGSNCLDVLMVGYLIHYVRFGRSWKPILSIFMFYGFRAIFQNFFLLSFYDTYLFDFPEVFSIVVPLGRSADFFYSGHCGSALLMALNFRDAGEHYYAYFGYFVTCLEAVVMTVTRAHYSIDVIYGIFFGFYFNYIASKIYLYCDQNYPFFTDEELQKNLNSFEMEEL